MIDTTTLSTFAVAALVLLIAPGPAVTFVIARSIEGGFKAGMLSQLGLCSGLLVHLIAATLGISALIAQSVVAFETLRLLGSGYLVWLGIRTFFLGRARQEDANCSHRSASPRGSMALFVDGFIIDTFNPKPALFFLAVLPQFIRSESLPATLQIGIFGSIFLALALITGTGYAAIAGAASHRLRHSARARNITRWATGTTYLVLGGTTAAWRR